MRSAEVPVGRVLSPELNSDMTVTCEARSERNLHMQRTSIIPCTCPPRGAELQDFVDFVWVRCCDWASNPSIWVLGSILELLRPRLRLRSAHNSDAMLLLNCFLRSMTCRSNRLRRGHSQRMRGYRDRINSSRLCQELPAEARYMIREMEYPKVV